MSDTSRRLPSLVGQRFGRLSVLREEPQGPRYERRYQCRCDCGQTRSVLQQHLRRGNTQSCGCLGRERNIAARTIRLVSGQRFGRLTVISEAGRHRKEIAWECRCDCGTSGIVIASYALRNGDKLSCGCLRLEAVLAACTTHGQTGSTEYKIWVGMKNRCFNPRVKGYANYGGRGITVCDRWNESFELFLLDVGPRPSPKHSIDRRDNNGNYEPGNAQWALPIEQANNSRHVHFVTVDGVTMSLTGWSRQTGVPAPCIRKRLKRGWPPGRAVLP